jgi:hypothetical protein
MPSDEGTVLTFRLLESVTNKVSPITPWEGGPSMKEDGVTPAKGGTVPSNINTHTKENN